MPKHILITGGAGFIGSHAADALLAEGHRVRVLDCLTPQVHGDGGDWPGYLDPRVECIRGDVCDPEDVRPALEGIDRVLHLAAAVGVGQSMYEIAHYTRVNNLGTAVLLEALAEQGVERLVVASSMSIYGEGEYERRNGEGSMANSEVEKHPRSAGAAEPPTSTLRTPQQLKQKEWDPVDTNGHPLVPKPTSESKPPDLASVYALSKYDQERMCLLVGQAYGIPTAALRFFNVFGPRQALSNPYTGVLAIFAARLLNDKPPLIFEDGLQRRDFVSVHDIADACVLALDADPTVTGPDAVFNIGSGRSVTIVDLARRLAHVMGVDVEPEVTGDYRIGDIRHCFADISRARKVLGYSARVSLEEGMTELARWLADQSADDHADHARAELSRRGLTV